MVGRGEKERVKPRVYKQEHGLLMVTCGVEVRLAHCSLVPKRSFEAVHVSCLGLNESVLVFTAFGVLDLGILADVGGVVGARPGKRFVSIVEM